MCGRKVVLAWDLLDGWDMSSKFFGEGAGRQETRNEESCVLVLGTHGVLLSDKSS